MQKSNMNYLENRRNGNAILEPIKYLDQYVKSKLVILISGKEGQGKTHLASSMSEVESVYLIDTEYRASIVTRKFKNIKLIAAKNYAELKNAVNFIIQNESSGTIIIDSASDLQIFAEIEYLNQTLKDKIGMTWNWSFVWQLCNQIIDMVKHSNRFNLILTARLKEEYSNNKPTGNLIPRIYSTLPYKADIMLQFSNDPDSKLVVTKNGFNNKQNVPLEKAISLPKIVSILSNNKQ